MGAVVQLIIVGVSVITVSISDTQDKELAAENSLRHFTSLFRMKQPFEFKSD